MLILLYDGDLFLDFSNSEKGQRFCIEASLGSTFRPSERGV